MTNSTPLGDDLVGYVTETVTYRVFLETEEDVQLFKEGDINWDQADVVDWEVISLELHDKNYETVWRDNCD